MPCSELLETSMYGESSVCILTGNIACCRMDEAAASVTGQYYRALDGSRDELASTSYELYTDASVS